MPSPPYSVFSIFRWLSGSSCSWDSSLPCPFCRRLLPPSSREAPAYSRNTPKGRRSREISTIPAARAPARAAKAPGKTGDNLLIAVERRLDNVVYRMGFAMTRRQARQLVNHAHFTVNGSFSIRDGKLSVTIDDED